MDKPNSRTQQAVKALHLKTLFYSYNARNVPVLVAAILGSNPIGGMDVFLFCVCCQVEVSATS
jgi:hypothetical protein